MAGASKRDGHVACSAHRTCQPGRIRGKRTMHTTHAQWVCHCLCQCHSTILPPPCLGVRSLRPQRGGATHTPPSGSRLSPRMCCMHITSSAHKRATASIAATSSGSSTSHHSSVCHSPASMLHTHTIVTASQQVMHGTPRTHKRLGRSLPPVGGIGVRPASCPPLAHRSNARPHLSMHRVIAISGRVPHSISAKRLSVRRFAATNALVFSK